MSDVDASTQGCSQTSDLILEEKRKVVWENFPRVGKRKISRFIAYLEWLGHQAALGDVDAAKELRLYDNLFTKIRDEDPTINLALDSGRQRFEEHLQEHQRKQKIFSKYAAYIAYFMEPEIRAAFEAEYGSKNISRIEPYHGLLKPDLDKLEAYFKRQWRKFVKGRPFLVGKGKPPTTTRFTRSGNITGLPKPKLDIADQSQKLQLEKVSVNQDGRTIKISKVELSTRQIFTKAMQGNKTARREIREIIKELFKRKMLSPLLTRRSKTAGEENAMLIYLYTSHFSSSVKNELMRVFTEAYGPLPEFETAFERALSTLDSFEAFKHRYRAGKAIEGENICEETLTEEASASSPSISEASSEETIVQQNRPQEEPDEESLSGSENRGALSRSTSDVSQAMARKELVIKHRNRFRRKEDVPDATRPIEDVAREMPARSRKEGRSQVVTKGPRRRSG
jgi:hypothetical protein